MKIHQGDQYLIPIQIMFRDEIITPDNCVDVRVKIEDDLVSYDDGEGDLTFDEENQMWCFNLTNAKSVNYNSIVSMQIGVKFNSTDYIYSDVEQIDCRRSIIKESWDA